MTTVLGAWLPCDLVALVCKHAASVTLQRRWRWFWRYGHARRRARWERVRLHLRRVGAWPQLFPYAHVRREWRTEPESWLLVNGEDVEIIVAEARSAMWGGVLLREVTAES